MSSGGIEAAKAFVRVYWEDSAIRRGIESTKAMLESTAANIGKMGAGMAGAGATILAPLTAAVFQFAGAGAAIDDMSQRTGASAEALSQLAYAAGQSGTDIGTVEKSMRKLGVTITDANSGSATAAKSLGVLGLKSAELAKMTPEKQMLAVADALAKVTDPGKRAAYAMDILGKSGADMLPLMNGGAKGIRELMDEADALGLTLSGEQAASAAAFDDMWDKLKNTFGAVSMQIGAALAPAITDLMGRVVPIIGQVVQWIRENGGLIKGVAMLGVGLVVAGAALTTFAGLLTGIAFVLGAIMSPLGIMIGLVAGLGVAIIQYFGGATNALNMLKDAFPGLLAPIQEVGGAILKFLNAGEYEKAANVLWLGLKLAWVTGVDALNQEWLVWKHAFLEVFDSAATYVAKKWAKLQNTLSKGIVGAMAFFDATINVDDVNAELDAMLQQQLATTDTAAASRQKERDSQFASNVGRVNNDLAAARAALAMSIGEAAALDPTVPEAVTNAQAALTTQLEGVSVNVAAATKTTGAQPQDVRTVSGAAQLTSLINKTGEVSRRHLNALLEIARNTSTGFAPQVVNL
jgi:TP901 family phage tail tape measure protein